MGGAETTGAGYANPAYCGSLAEFGEPRLLPRCGGSVLMREIAGSGERDAIGPYPLFSCRDWGGLGEDIAELEERLVSVTLVTTPFCPLGEAELRECFGDLVTPFKEHFAAELSDPPLGSVRGNHRRAATQALRRLEVELVAEPRSLLDDWCSLYAELIERHGVRGIAAFSRAGFAAQLALPEMVAFRARRAGQLAGASLWLREGDVAHYHLAAHSEIGLEAGASHALMATAFEHFSSEGVRWLALGAGAGASADGSDGLTMFKRGWASTTRTAYLCGRILNRRAYSELAEAGPASETAYFPAYRAGEFG